jgi:hypothetical protein
MSIAISLRVRPRNRGIVYCAPSGLGRVDSTGTQGVALGYHMAPFQGFVQKNMPSPNGAKHLSPGQRPGTPMQPNLQKPCKAVIEGQSGQDSPWLMARALGRCHANSATRLPARCKETSFFAPVVRCAGC